MASHYLRKWAGRNPVWARWMIFLFLFVLSFFCYLFGIFLHLNEVDLHLILYPATLLICAGIWILNDYLPRNNPVMFYLGLPLLLSGCFLFVISGNFVERTGKINISKALFEYNYTNDKPPDEYFTGAISIKSTALGEYIKKHRITMHSGLSGIVKQFYKVRPGISAIDQALIIIGLSIVFLLAVYFVLVIACRLDCNGYHVLAQIVLWGGLALVLFLYILSLMRFAFNRSLSDAKN